MDDFVPIALFAYCRPEHTRKVLNGLRRNSVKKIYAFSDAAKTARQRGDVLQVRAILRAVDWCDITIIERETNYGLGKSIIDGINYVLARHERIIVIEDDIVMRPGAYEWVTSALNQYETSKEVMSISMFRYDALVPDEANVAFFSQRIICSGWATYREAWNKFDKSVKMLYEECLDRGINVLQWGEDIKWQVENSELLNLWAVGFVLTHLLHGGLSLIPVESTIVNIGFDGTGENTSTRKDINVNLDSIDIPVTLPSKWPIAVLHAQSQTLCEQYFRPKIKKPSSIIRKVGSKIKKQLLNVYRLVKNEADIARGIKLRQSIETYCAYEHYGSTYGGWCVCKDALPKNAIIYSLGIGEDITFDLEMIANINARIFAFDPTPRSAQWIKQQKPSMNFKFYPYAIAGLDGFIDFYPPDDPEHVSYSILPKTSDYKETMKVPAYKISTLVNKMAHKKIDILKMDIEGAEYDAIDDLFISGLDISQILVEFHHRFPGVGIAKTKEAINKLHKMGYRAFFISKNGEEYSFIKQI